MPSFVRVRRMDTFGSELVELDPIGSRGGDFMVGRGALVVS